MKCMWPNGGFTPPVFYKNTPTGFRWTSAFGLRTHPVTGAPSTFHYGLDMIGWDTIKSPVNGVVTFAGYNGAAGNEVRIKEDGTGDVFRLLHNRVLHVRTGNRVAQGQAVAIMGTTGSSTGIHCHEETRPKGGAAINPLVYYANRNASSSGGGSKPLPKEIKVKNYQRTDATAKARGREVAPGGAFWLNTTDKAPVSQATNIVGGVGDYSFVAHVYAEGNPGDLVHVTLYWDDTKTSGPHSGHYVETLEIGSNGTAHRNIPWQRAVTAGFAVYAQLRADAANKKPVKVSRFDTDARLYTVA